MGVLRPLKSSLQAWSHLRLWELGRPIFRPFGLPGCCYGFFLAWYLVTCSILGIWAEFPKSIFSEWGLNNGGGVFVEKTCAADVYCINIGPEALNQIGKVERHGGLRKLGIEKVVQERHITEPRWMKLMVAEVTAVMNSQNRVGGCPPDWDMREHRCRRKSLQNGFGVGGRFIRWEIPASPLYPAR